MYSPVNPPRTHDWAVFFGSPAVLTGFVALLWLVNFVIVPHEERILEGAFGQTYLQYKNRVPRRLIAQTSSTGTYLP